MDVIRDQWSPALHPDLVLLSISSLLTDPNPHDAVNREAARVYRNDRIEYQLLAQEWTRKYSAEPWVSTTPQLVLTLFCRQLNNGAFSISGKTASGHEAAVVEVRGSAPVSDLYATFCQSLGRSLESVTLVLPEGITLRDALQNAKAVGVLSERREVKRRRVSFDELVQSNVSNEAYAGQPYDYILAHSVQQWEEVPCDAYTVQDIFT